MVSVMNLLKDLWRRHCKRRHEFVLCKYDRKPQRLSVVIQGNSMVILAKPYGSSYRSELQGFTRPSEQAISIVRAILNLFHEMHAAGYALDGKFSVENLYLLPNKKMKISGLEKGALLDWRATRAENDFALIHDLIKYVLFKGYMVPNELSGLMLLLVKNPIRYEELILNNIILHDDAQKVAEYISCYQQLQQVQKHNEMIYRIALTYIKERHEWDLDIANNSVLMSVFAYNGGKAYDHKTDNEGPLIFGRHCCNHLLDYSVDAVDKSILFTMADEFAMIELCLPGLFAEVQRALFEVTQILFPKELSVLRATSSSGERMPIKSKSKAKKTKSKAKKGDV